MLRLILLPFFVVFLFGDIFDETDTPPNRHNETDIFKEKKSDYNALEDFDSIKKYRLEQEKEELSKARKEIDETMKDECYCVFNLCLLERHYSCNGYTYYDEECTLEVGKSNVEDLLERRKKALKKKCYAWRDNKTEFYEKQNSQIAQIDALIEKESQYIKAQREKREQEERAKKEALEQQIRGEVYQPEQPVNPTSNYTPNSGSEPGSMDK